jgi:molybdopterin-containing oxidoreductase family membrane subunit
MSDHLEKIDTSVLTALKSPLATYFGFLSILGMVAGIAALVFLYQIKTGMGVTGLGHPVGWAVYITNFVFWIGIAHSGTLISAILFLVRAKYRDAVSRASEAMTLFAIAIAGLFPLIHLGRFWVFYFILPYPSERQIWPNFISPLVWDVMAVSTYFTVSAIFFYVGLIPDLAAGREYFAANKGARHPRTLLYRALSLNWCGSADQWRHYGRSYLYFAALATPLVVSVHSIVSWDFAMSLLPGWHVIIFPPYFVAGAIHSGLAMVLLLVIPMRRALKLEDHITVHHLERLAQTLLVTTAIMGYSYMVEPFISWYKQNRFEHQFSAWRAAGMLSWAFWSIYPLNVLAPALFVFRKVRRSIPWMLGIAFLVIAGMWIERYMIIVSGLAHDFLPHNWGGYAPRWVEIVITTGSFGLFLFLFLSFTKALPVLPLSDIKMALVGEPAMVKSFPGGVQERPLPSGGGIVGIFLSASSLLDAVAQLRNRGFKNFEAFSPVRLNQLSRLMGFGPSPVRYWTLAGGLFGICFGYGLAIFASWRNHLIVGGKHPLALIPYSIIAFEMCVLFGSIVNLIGMVINARLLKTTVRGYDPRFVQNRFGIFLPCSSNEYSGSAELLRSLGAHETLQTKEDLS